ncbi:nuclear transport factor 2 family protein [Methylobacterium sp. J-078]|uniref:nuclear transport factor 2 family protein n=1 Tax=Methylobacterium sp. J-078 TaxID=2836657 RepID=UPI001FBA044C|nr:nuclear transport factor 2 family protein [Methylobacterium sp. J-078]MCJ2043443.1 nuclear transport factor 2 family protein [Methylobacterium sp. J-078]
MSARFRPMLRAALAAGLLAGSLMTSAPSYAATPEAEVEAAVDDLTRAILAADGTALDALVLDGLSYGHSSGAVQDKAAFVEALASRRSSFPSITLSNRKASIVGDDAIVRHVFDGETVSNGKTVPVHIGVLQVWHREGGRWRLLARQAFKL